MAGCLSPKIEKDDVVNIEYKGILEGETEPFDGGSDEGKDLTIGSGQFIDGFEDGLIGKKVGEKNIVLNLTFPDDYKDKEKEADLAAKFNGKNVTFTVTVCAPGARTMSSWLPSVRFPSRLTVSLVVILAILWMPRAS